MHPTSSAFALCSLLSAGLLLAACKSADTDKLDIYVNSAYVHWDQGDIDRAQSQALKGLAIDRKNGPLNLMMGWILLRRDNRDDLLRAEQVFRRVIDEDEDPRALQGLAATQERLATLYREAADLVLSGERKTASSDVAARAGELRAEANARAGEALSLYQRVLEERPDFIKALNGAMRTTAALEDWDASLAWSARLIETVRSEQTYWVSILQRENIAPREEQDLRKQVENATQLLVDTHLFAANLLHDLGREAEALEHLDQTVALDPFLPEAYSLRAQAFFGRGRLSEAVADLDRFLKMSDKPFEHPDIRRALDLRTDWSRQLVQAQ